MKKHLFKSFSLSFLFSFLLPLLLSSCGVNDSSNATPSAKLKVCPEAWIVNAMPTVTGGSQANTLPAEYFVLNGKRRELSEFDVEWVKQNCSVQPQTVY